MVVVLVGATGLLGQAIAKRLRSHQLDVRALVRPGSPGESRLRDLGCSAMAGDLKEPASLTAACRGAASSRTSAARR